MKSKYKDTGKIFSHITGGRCYKAHFNHLQLMLLFKP